MSRLDELIQELCPDGVEYKSLEEISHYAKLRIDASEVDASTYVGVENLLQNKQGKTDASSVPATGAVIAFEGGDILIGNIRPYLRKIWLATHSGGTNGDVLPIQINNRSEISPEFLYYVLSSERFFLYDIQNSKGAKMPRGSKDAVMQFAIPVPPIEVQREIVRILDKFTELSAELAAKLSEEFSARQKQYAYYREKILSRTNNAEQYALQDIVADSCSISYGIVQTGDDVEKGIPIVRPVDLVDKIVSLRGLKRVAPSIAEPYKRTILKGGDLLLCVRGTTGVISIASDELKGCNVSRGIVPLTFKSTVCPRYIYYQFLSQGIQKEIESKTRGTALKQINMEDLRRIRFPVPALEVQQQIVDILEHFDTLCNDLSSGLPAEIEARQKQYEYYRDKLLTFKPLEQ